jgi:hypothetical protein
VVSFTAVKSAVRTVPAPGRNVTRVVQVVGVVVVAQQYDVDGPEVVRDDRRACGLARRRPAAEPVDPARAAKVGPVRTHQPTTSMSTVGAPIRVELPVGGRCPTV